jgi:hypothetical protein
MRATLMAVFGLGLGSISGCGSEPDSPDGRVGSLHASVELSEVQHGVSAVHLKVVAAGEDCAGSPISEQVVSLEAEALPEPLAEGGTHAFGGGLFVLPEGSYRICATPLTGNEPSETCDATDTEVTISSGITSEVMLVSQCGKASNGGAGVIVALNDAPVITRVELDPSQFISICETVTLTATASDSNEDELDYSWSIAAGPSGGRLSSSGAGATFSGPVGDFSLSLVVSDSHGGSAELTFPIHVSDAVCSVPTAVQEIFEQRCSPCHTTGASGGLRLPSATQSYASLVGVGSSSASCSSRTRVVPGDSASSYLIAKLRGAPDICGLPMPRNAPALPEAEISTIEDWILTLPH